MVVIATARVCVKMEHPAILLTGHVVVQSAGKEFIANNVSVYGHMCVRVFIMCMLLHVCVCVCLNVCVLVLECVLQPGAVKLVR